MIDHPLALAAVIAMATAAAFLIEAHVPVLGRLSAGLLAIILGALLSNLGIVAPESPVYDVVAGPITMVSIGLLLLAVDLAGLRHVGLPILAAFGLAVLGTALGATLAGVAFGGLIPEAESLAGTLAGSYTGGAVNFVSVGEGLGLSELLFTGALASDALLTAAWMGVCLLLPANAGGGADDPVLESSTDPPAPPFVLSHASTYLALALGLFLLGERAGLATGVPSVLWLTTLALVVGHLLPLPNRALAGELGNLGLHVFFVAIGVFSRIPEIVAVGPAVFLFVLTVLVVHAATVLGVGRLCGLETSSLVVASQAAVGGPSTALAVAVARGWRPLVVPGVLVGLVGYALGTYLGFGIATGLGLLR